MAPRPRNEEELQFDACVGARICRTRKALGMKGVDLARALDISQQRLSSYESGYRCPPFLLESIASKLGVGVQALIPTDKDTA